MPYDILAASLIVGGIVAFITAGISYFIGFKEGQRSGRRETARALGDVLAKASSTYSSSQPQNLKDTSYGKAPYLDL